MKKICMLICICSFITYVDVMMVEGISNVGDVGTLMFMNTKEFPKFQIQVLSIKHIITFCGLFYVLLFHMFSEINEVTSFTSMVVYRQSLRDYFFNNFRRKIKICIMYFIILSLMICVTSLLIRINTICMYDLVNLFLYLVKYFVLLLFFGLLYDLSCLVGNSTKVSIYIYAIFLALVITDLSLGSRFILFSADSTYESICCILYIVVLIGYYVIGFRYLKRKGDIL